MRDENKCVEHEADYVRHEIYSMKEMDDDFTDDYISG